MKTMSPFIKSIRAFVYATLILLSIYAASEKATAQLLLAPQSVNFGTLTCSQTIISTTIVIQNTGATALFISGAAISPPNSDFTILSPLNVSVNFQLLVNPTATQAIVVAYNPQRVGTQNVSLVLASNSANTTTGITSILLTSQRDSSGFQLSTTNVTWTNVSANTPAFRTITVRNTGSVPFTLASPQFSGAFAIDSVVPASIAPNTEGRIFTRFFGAPSGITTATSFALTDGCGRVTALQMFASVQAPPTVTGISPNVGTAGTQVIITGTNLSNTSSVFFGGVQAQSFTVISPTQIVATVGQGGSGPVFVNVGGVAALSPQEFRFVPQPSVLFFSPTTGGTATVLTLIGTNLDAVTGVSIGGVPAQSFFINSPTQITATVGRGASGPVSVTTQLGTTSSTLRFTFIPAPEILFITPQVGPAGTIVTIIGNNLAGVTAVRFGGVSAQSFTQVSSTQILATIGTEGASGLVSVVTPGGTAFSPQAFSFTSPPSVTFVSPTIGIQGTTVNIIGSNFNNVTGVSFGGVAAQSFTVSSPSQIIATVGQGASGNIIITTQNGSTTASQQFTYAAPPTITFFTPTAAMAGTTVNIFGTGFSNASSVVFGGIPARSFTVISPTQISAVPGNQGATGLISVVTPFGAGSSQNQFAFIPTIGVKSTSNDAALKLYCTPNPTSGATTLHYSLAETATVNIEILSILGERVLIISEGKQHSGTHSIELPASHFSQGVYLCRVQAGTVLQTTFLHIVR